MNKLIEKLEKLTNKKVILTEESPKQNAVVEYLKTHPGATIPQMSLDIWNKDYDKLKGTSLVTTVVRTIGAAFENGLIFRDEAVKPYKYYARSIKLPKDGVKRDLKYGTKPGRFSQTPQTPEPIVPIVAQKRTYDEYVKLITDYLKVHVGIPVKDLFQFFPTQISAVPVLQKMLKTGVIVKDNNQRPALWYLKGTEPTGANTTIQPKAPRLGNIKELLNKIASDFEYFRPDGERGNDIDINEKYLEVTKDFRYLGRWVDDYEDEQEDYEDNDQRVWASGEYERYFKKFKEWAKQYPWYKKATLDLDTSEKDWCYFSIKIKK